MDKRFLLVKPSEFVRLADIDIDGNVQYAKCEDFQDLNDPKENVVIFQIGVDNRGRFTSTARELVTGKKFTLNVAKNRKDVTDPIFNLESDELGLYMQRYLPISSCMVKPIKVSGLMYHITDQIEEEELYCSELKYMFEEAENAKYIYDEAVNGPSRFIRSEISRTFRRSVRMDRDEE